jgi:deaminated glutathione amidase
MKLASALVTSLPIAAAARPRVRRAMSSSVSAAARARVGVVQMTSVGDVDANYATCSRLTKVNTPLVPCPLPSLPT